jgi:hypothetical protein
MSIDLPDPGFSAADAPPLKLVAANLSGGMIDAACPNSSVCSATSYAGSVANLSSV